MHDAVATPNTSALSLGLVIELIGIVIGVFAITIIVAALRKIGGQVGSVFSLTLVGVIFQISALIYNIIFRELQLLPSPEIDGLLQTHNIHEALMIIGLVFFVLAAKKFSDLSQ